MELSLLWTIAMRELRESLRNKWLVFYAVGFAALAFALSQASLASAGYSGLGGFGRTAASLINALLLFVPLLGLSVGANAIAADREKGSLAYLMAQPVNRAEIFFGKAVGSGVAVTAALAVGFGFPESTGKEQGIPGLSGCRPAVGDLNSALVEEPVRRDPAIPLSPPLSA